MKYLLLQSKGFKNNLKKYLQKHPQQFSKLLKILELLSDDPFNPTLKTHKLMGKYESSWACSAGFNLRIIFSFINEFDETTNTNVSKILLETLGNHDDVY
jgi:addiction module RelE/StbE family toxin